MNGTVNDDLLAILRLELVARGGERLTVDAIVDAGFNGFLTLPRSVMDALGAPVFSRGRAILADGREELFDIHRVTVDWDGQLISVEAEVTGSAALVGTALFENCNLHMQVRIGGEFTITKSN